MGQFDEDCIDELSTRGEDGLVYGRRLDQMPRPEELVGDKLLMVKEDHSLEMEDDSSKVMQDDSIEGRMERKFERMMEGRQTFSNLRTPDRPPPWLDKEVSQCGFIRTVKIWRLRM